ncbi:MAG TPA: post-transcriptional regulator [Bacillales bacterium]|nr:post-transcriptional regulator [Bacillales bacterium]
MSITAGYEEWKEKLAPVVEIKAEEFELLGYGEVDKESVWKCVVGRINRVSPDKLIYLHDFVNRLLRLSINDYMNWLRIDSLKGPDLFSSKEPLNLDEFDEPLT